MAMHNFSYDQTHSLLETGYCVIVDHQRKITVGDIYTAKYVKDIVFDDDYDFHGERVYRKITTRAIAVHSTPSLLRPGNYVILQFISEEKIEREYD